MTTLFPAGLPPLIDGLVPPDYGAAIRLLSQVKQNRVVHEITHLSDLCYTCSAMSGWHTGDNGEPIQQNHGERIALMHSELSEALEAIRKDEQSMKLPGLHGVEEELADAVIRIFDYAGRNNLRLGEAMARKLVYNAGRADHKPEARKAPGGKKF